VVMVISVGDVVWFGLVWSERGLFWQES
jgi:hypothetical protein